MMAKISLPPGFRFHPTDVELVWYYLKRKVMGKPFQFDAISEVELYKFAPWDLPVKSSLQSRDLEWYFFCPRDRKYANGSRTNRATDIGYWKATGNDRPIVYNSQSVGMKKTLIFHLGKVPRGTRTDWVMYEYRLDPAELVNAGSPQDTFVLCKIFKKSGPGPKKGEQYGALIIEEDWGDTTQKEHSLALPCFPSHESSKNNHAFVADPVIPVPLQSVPFEAGESSSMVHLSEVGDLTSIPLQSVASEVGEPSSMVALSEVGQPASSPEISPVDGMTLEQLEELLMSSPPHPENANSEMFLHKEANGILDEELDGLGIGLDDIPFPDIMGYDDSLHQLSGFADESYMELNDINFWNAKDSFELPDVNDTCYPFGNTSSAKDLNSIFRDGDNVTSAPSGDNYSILPNFRGSTSVQSVPVAERLSNLNGYYSTETSPSRGEEL
ncbi:NAC domain-containing protein 53-like isoform X1 [Iris pallida]|uniref:NAC domain-containing protein 53-like isoform X1 n=1 Tax=Iris pallida TaxID=29817 RepID=A0AAX6EGV1_IRIPA|nr:NAC domain-containing protein 53-like isoform X1 [Iris pallida]